MDALFGGQVAANDNLPKPRNRNLARENMRRLEKAPERICELCGNAFKKVSKDKQPLRFCSKACSSSASIRTINAKRAPKPASYSVFRPLCGQCGTRFNARSRVEQYCSVDCRTLIERARSRRYSAANDNVDRSPRQCRECGAVFATSYGDFRTVYCSKLCGRRSARRAARKKERARLRGPIVEMVNPTIVFDRDKWKCQLCGVLTPRMLRGTYDNRAPELDHIMPLSKGGEHSYANTQCACRRCNALKSDTPMGQMRLFG